MDMPVTVVAVDGARTPTRRDSRPDRWPVACVEVEVEGTRTSERPADETEPLLSCTPLLRRACVARFPALSDKVFAFCLCKVGYSGFLGTRSHQHKNPKPAGARSRVNASTMCFLLGREAPSAGGIPHTLEVVAQRTAAPHPIPFAIHPKQPASPFFVCAVESVPHTGWSVWRTPGHG